MKVLVHDEPIDNDKSSKDTPFPFKCRIGKKYGYRRQTNDCKGIKAGINKLVDGKSKQEKEYNYSSSVFMGVLG